MLTLACGHGLLETRPQRYPDAAEEALEKEKGRPLNKAEGGSFEMKHSDFCISAAALSLALSQATPNCTIASVPPHLVCVWRFTPLFYSQLSPSQVHLVMFIVLTSSPR